MKKPLGKMQRVSLREAWSHEANEFTPWLAQEESLALLGEALGLSNLTLVSRAHPIGDFKLDLLCSDGEDQVIIENQIAETDHRHLGQLLSYAAGVGAKKIIWIAERFRDEHAAALTFLNESSTDDVAYFGVEVELWRIDDSLLAPKFEVRVKPDSWSRTNRLQAHAAAHTTPTKQLQLRFWMALVECLTAEAPDIRPHRPRMQHWLSHSIGKSGLALNVTANTRDQRLGVELWIQREDAKQLFAALSEHRKEVESRLGFKLDWQDMPASRACRIVSYLEDAPIDQEHRWPEFLRWLTARIMAMDKVFRPLVKQLP